MTQTGSTALTVIAWISLAVAFASASAIAYDIFVRGYRQHMAIMHAVYPITALYWGPLAVWLYFRRGRRMSRRWAEERGADMDEMMSDDRDEPRSAVAFARKNWWPVSKGVSHCGAGCTLGDIVGEWLIYAFGWTIGGFALEKYGTICADFVVDFGLAWTLGIVFQYYAIVPMRESIGRLEGIWAAIKADTLSILSFQLGLFGFMALYHLVIWDPPLSVASSGYWLMMQIGMIVGFFTAWPVNVWLIRRGWKEKM